MRKFYYFMMILLLALLIPLVSLNAFSYDTFSNETELSEKVKTYAKDNNLLGINFVGTEYNNLPKTTAQIVYAEFKEIEKSVISANLFFQDKNNLFGFRIDLPGDDYKKFIMPDGTYKMVYFEEKGRKLGFSSDFNINPKISKDDLEKIFKVQNSKANVFIYDLEKLNFVGYKTFKYLAEGIVFTSRLPHPNYIDALVFDVVALTASTIKKMVTNTNGYVINKYEGYVYLFLPDDVSEILNIDVHYKVSTQDRGKLTGIKYKQKELEYYKTYSNISLKEGYPENNREITPINEYIDLIKDPSKKTLHYNLGLSLLKHEIYTNRKVVNLHEEKKWSNSRYESFNSLANLLFNNILKIQTASCDKFILDFNSRIENPENFISYSTIWNIDNNPGAGDVNLVSLMEAVLNYNYEKFNQVEKDYYFMLNKTFENKNLRFKKADIKSGFMIKVFEELMEDGFFTNKTVVLDEFVPLDVTYKKEGMVIKTTDIKGYYVSVNNHLKDTFFDKALKGFVSFVKKIFSNPLRIILVLLIIIFIVILIKVILSLIISKKRYR